MKRNNERQTTLDLDRSWSRMRFGQPLSPSEGEKRSVLTHCMRVRDFYHLLSLHVLVFLIKLIAEF